ncbi:MerR family transcriptional regulator [Nocardia cyriacigeorgica]|uniref:MerR family transcriptional regulator n=2 Tax=Nocardia cyriacigeorgica TaxID=135487 RepID=UPI001E48CB1B|nr:helix-turn-helix domain-containing protein [Nocardia cyriacigeorgica]
MLSIGDFARHGRVSVRMLRHHDALGLLRPDRIDPATGYRYYQAGQLARLNRIAALKDLGFTLEQVGRILDGQVDGAQLRGMLTLRRAELEQRIAADRARLVQIEARLRVIEKESVMPRAVDRRQRIPHVRPHPGGHPGLCREHRRMGHRIAGAHSPRLIHPFGPLIAGVPPERIGAVSSACTRS